MSKSKKNNVNTGLFLLISGFICAMCCVGIAFINVIDIGSIYPTPISESAQVIPLGTIIFQTASAAQAQTSIASSPTEISVPLSTVTLAPTITVESTATVFIFDLQTSVAQPTNFMFSTNTPFVLSTQPIATSVTGICSCTSDSLNCENFQTHSSAQACFEYCISIGAGDIHKLDQNNNGVSCEDLP